MAKQTINIGSTANDGTGSTLRVGGDIINDNFNEIYTAFGDGSTLTAPLTAAGTATLTNKTIDLFPLLNDLAFQTVVKSLFTQAANSKDMERLQCITEANQRMLVKELRQPYLGWWFKIGGALKKHLKLSEEARTILKGIVAERKASGHRFDDLLDMLLETKYDDGKGMSETQLIDEILIIFTAGHETTSNALTFTFQLLAKHPEWQDKIYDEWSELGGDDADLMTRVSTSKNMSTSA